MAHPLQGGLQFEPSLEEFAKERAGSHLTVLSGGNNGGKSLVLKSLKHTMGKTSADSIKTIGLKAKATRSTVGYVTLTYEFANLDPCLERVKKMRNVF